ncbi:MAG: hypothetical protein V3574_04740 [Candidatus Moraniibacteriota bacterium]
MEIFRNLMVVFVFGVFVAYFTPHKINITIENKEAQEEITLFENDDSKKEVTSLSGDVFFVDISKEKCLRFGFEHGDIIINSKNQIFVVAGVAPYINNGVISHEVLWFFNPADNGKVSIWEDDPEKTNLRQEGFRKIEEEEKEEKKEVFFLI